jgi:hypothetical protein
MRKSLVVLLMLSTTLMGVEPTLLVTKAGYFNVYVDANGVPQTPVKIQHVVLIGDAPTPPPDDPGPGPTPAPTGLAARIATMSKSKLPNIDEGTALTAAVNLVTKSVNSDESVKAALDGMVNVVGLGLNAKTRVDAWYVALQAVDGFAFTKAGLQATLVGLQSAYNVDSAVVSSLVDTVVNGVAAGQTVEEIAASLGADNPNAVFDFTMIMTILMALLDLLKTLGIIT